MEAPVLPSFDDGPPLAEVSVRPFAPDPMDDVITLSDDDDDIEVTAHIQGPRSPMTPKTMANRGRAIKATVHVSNGAKLHMEQLRRIAPYQRPQTKSNQYKGMDKINFRNAGQQTSRMPIPVDQIHEMARENSIRRIRPNLPDGPITQLVTPSTARTRNNHNAMISRKFYMGFYMFEATEGYEPSRRSARNNLKKIDGKFVCSFNPSGCYKLCSDVIEMINHVISHAMNDPPPAPAPRTIPTTGNLIYSLGSESILSTNCSGLERRMRMCQFCNTEFKTAFHKQEHIISCHIEMDFIETVCNICEIDTLSGINLKIHLEKHEPGEAPYVCKKCKYRTSVRTFFYQHYVEKHSNEALLCPLCLYSEDLRPSTRRSKHIYVRTFVEHVRRHATNPQFRCKKCALSFNDRADMLEHESVDHTPLNMLWQTQERRKVDAGNKRFIPLNEDEPMHEEMVSESVDVKRIEIDGPNKGEKQYKKAITDIERVGRVKALDKDPRDEIRIFSVYPPVTMTEMELKEVELERLKTIEMEMKDPYNLQVEDKVLEQYDRILYVKMMAFNNDDESTDIIGDCCADLDSDDE